jgi:uncharacterized membrane protein
MPLAIADIAPLLYALLTLALAICALLLAKVIAQMIPNLPVIGSSLRDAITGAGNTVYQFLIGQAHGAWTVAHDIITDVVWADKWIANYTVQCISHLGDQASHIWATLEQDAINLQNNINTVVDSTIPVAISTLSDQVLREIGATATSLQNNIDRVVDDTIPQAISDENAKVDALISSTATSLQNNINSLAQDVTNDLAQVWDSIGPLQTAVSTTLPGLIAEEAASQAAATSAAAATAHAELVTATQNLQSNLNNVQAGLTESITNATAASQALAQADLNTAEGVSAAQAAQATVAAEAVSQAALTFQAEALQQQIDQNQQQIDTLEATQTISLPQVYGITSPGTITVPLAVAALATEVVAVTTEIGECMVTSCDGPNSLENNLLRLSGLFSTVGELSFVAAAVKDPQGTADALSDVVSGFWDAGESLFDTLLAL